MLLSYDINIFNMALSYDCNISYIINLYNIILLVFGTTE